MRTFLALVLMMAAGAAAALDTARSLAASGARHLALGRIEKLQPADPRVAQWGDWETLRLATLVELKRYDDVLKRVAMLPAELPPVARRRCLLLAARAAVAAGRAEEARGYAARVLWQLEPTAEEARDARLLVIDSHLAERQGDPAFRAMLRFDQDYRPLGREVAERFVAGLLDLGLEKDAVNWMAALDDAGALKLRLRLRTGLIAPDAAVAQARMRLAKRDDAGDWRVLADAADRLNDGALRVEAMERLLQAGETSDPSQAAALWKAYSVEAQSAANQNRLLTGDDGAWLDVASRQLGASPSRARALFAHLFRQASARETRQAAQLQLVFSLYQAGLDQAALRLFEPEPGVEAFDPRARYLLGVMAEARDVPAAAARYWQDLPAPADTGAAEWQVRRAVMQWRAGMEKAALTSIEALARQGDALPDAVAAKALALAREVFDAGRLPAAETLYAGLLPIAGKTRERDILVALGDVAASGARFAAAADYYLRAALADEARLSDAFALRARFSAAASLARAGYRDDARAQYQWLLKHSKDPVQTETARRELGRL